MSLFKARHVYCNKDKGGYVEGSETIINMRYVIRFEKMTVKNMGNINLPEGKDVFIVDTTIDHTAHSLRVTSKYLEEMMETIK